MLRSYEVAEMGTYTEMVGTDSILPVLTGTTDSESGGRRGKQKTQQPR